MINKIILVGRLGRDPEIRYTSSEKAVCNFSIATDEGFGEKKRTEWHNIVLWEKTAEIAAKYLFKGSLVYIEGRLQTRSFEDRDGIMRYKTEVIGQRMQMLSAKNLHEQTDMPEQTGMPVEKNDAYDDDEDIPF